MKFSMIFEAVDQASKVMGKIMTSEKKLASTVKNNAAKAERASGKVRRGNDAITRSMAGVKRASQAAFRAVIRGANRAGQSIRSLHQKTINLGKKGFGSIRDGAGKLGRGLALSTGILASVYGSAALAAGSMIDVASQFEKFQTVLETTEGSSAKAKTAMSWVTNFAVKTPYELDKVMESFVRMRTNGLDPTNGSLRILGDTAAAMDKPLIQAVEAMADAVTGENERLKEFGITASKTGKLITYEYTNALGKTMTATVKAGDRLAIQQTLMKIWGDKFGGAMEKLSQTWAGMVANMGDLWQKFQLMIMDAGLFDWMKDKLRFILDTISKMEADGTLKEWAVGIGQSIKGALTQLWYFAIGAWKALKWLSATLKSASDTVGGWKNLVMILGAIAFAPTLVATATGLIMVAKGVALIGAALVANPIGLAIAVIAGGAYLIYRNWDGIVDFLDRTWQQIKSVFSSPLSWSAVIPALIWPKFVGKLIWATLISPFKWGMVLSKLIWAKQVSRLPWVDFVSRLNWASVIKPFKWMTALPRLAWSAFITIFRWASVIGTFTWSRVIAPLRWLSLVPKLSWSMLVKPLRWGARLIPGIGWAALAGELAWHFLIKPLGWDKYVSIDGLKAVWKSITDWFSKLDWPDLPSLTVPSFDSFKQLVIDFFLLKWLPDWTWPKIPMPDLPDIGALISETAASASAAWNRMTSIFSDEDPISIAARDPASIERATIATNTLRTAMEGVARADTSGAIGKLNMVRDAANAIPDVVQSAMRRVDAVLAGVSLYRHGVRMMDTLAAGMQARAQVVVNQIKATMQQVRDHLPSSPAKVGPLSDIHRLKFGETIAQSIRAEPMIRAMHAATAATLAAATPIASSAHAVPVPSAQSALPASSQARSVRAYQSGKTRSPEAEGGKTIVNLKYAPVMHLTGDAASAEATFRKELQKHSREIRKIVGQEFNRELRRKH